MERTTNQQQGLVNPTYVLTGEELVSNNIVEIPKLIDPILPKVGLVAIAGSSDTGKSSFLRQLGMDIVSGKEDFLGFDILAEHRSVIYVSTEDDEYAISSLIKKQNTENLPADSYRGLRYIFDTENLLGKLTSELERQPADMVIIDAFSDLYGGDLNRVNEVRNYLHNFVGIANKYRCLIIFLHHTSKRTETLAPSKHNLIGSQGFEGKARLVIELRKDYQNSASSLRHLCIVKGNYLTEDFKNRSFALRFTQSLRFENTGIRVAFKDLGPRDGRQVNASARERAIELRGERLTIDQVHERMLEEGYTISRSTVHNYVNS